MPGSPKAAREIEMGMREALGVDVSSNESDVSPSSKMFPRMRTSDNVGSLATSLSGAIFE